MQHTCISHYLVYIYYKIQVVVVLWTQLDNNRDGSSPVSTISIKEYTANITITTYKLLSCPQLLMHRYHHPIKYRCMHRRSFGFQAHVNDPRHFAI
jgi:hypothetical protein